MSANPDNSMSAHVSRLVGAYQTAYLERLAEFARVDQAGRTVLQVTALWQAWAPNAPSSADDCRVHLVAHTAIMDLLSSNLDGAVAGGLLQEDRYVIFARLVGSLKLLNLQFRSGVCSVTNSEFSEGEDSLRQCHTLWNAALSDLGQSNLPAQLHLALQSMLFDIRELTLRVQADAGRRNAAQANECA